STRVCGLSCGATHVDDTTERALPNLVGGRLVAVRPRPAHDLVVAVRVVERTVAATQVCGAEPAMLRLPRLFLGSAPAAVFLHAPVDGYEWLPASRLAAET